MNCIIIHILIIYEINKEFPNSPSSLAQIGNWEFLIDGSPLYLAKIADLGCLAYVAYLNKSASGDSVNKVMFAESVEPAPWVRKVLIGLVWAQKHPKQAMLWPPVGMIFSRNLHLGAP